MVHKALVLFPKKGVSGNRSTANRIGAHLIALEHDVDMTDVSTGISWLTSSSDVIYTLVVTIHAYKSAILLSDDLKPVNVFWKGVGVLDSVLPADTQLVLIFGGTDLNVHIDSVEDKAIMRRVVERSRCCVAFSATMKTAACKAWPEFADRVRVISHGVSTHTGTFNIREHMLTHCNHHVKENIILLVAGIRPVKDVLYLVKAFAESKLCENTSFIIIGPVIDEIYAAQVVAIISQLRDCNVVYGGELSGSETLSAMKQSSCLVNSSTSEGMSQAILEAFDVGIPVIARDIPGNADIIEHNITGLLYKTPQEFLDCAENIMNSKELSNLVTCNARRQVDERFSSSRERELYKNLIDQL